MRFSSFVGAKHKDVLADKMGQFGVGSVWTCTVIGADTKLCVSFLASTVTRARPTSA